VVSLHPAPRFNPRPPHGRRLAQHHHGNVFDIVSIHAPLTGGDSTRSTLYRRIPFQSTPPLTGGDATGALHSVI